MSGGPATIERLFRSVSPSIDEAAFVEPEGRGPKTFESTPGKHAAETDAKVVESIPSALSG